MRPALVARALGGLAVSAVLCLSPRNALAEETDSGSSQSDGTLIPLLLIAAAVILVISAAAWLLTRRRR